MSTSPLIALSCREDGDKNRINLAYSRAVENLGGVPVLLPSLLSVDAKKAIVGKISGLILTGGVDVDPYYFGEEPIRHQGEIEPGRDKMEMFITKKALDKNLPVLGICRGMQVLNIAAGGDIYQDIYSQLETSIKHDQKAPGCYPTHSIDILEETKLHRITGKRNLRVNSFHHQAVNNIAPGFVASAYSADGIVEGIESEKYKFALAVQWHPELMCPGHVESEKVFGTFVESC